MQRGQNFKRSNKRLNNRRSIMSLSHGITGHGTVQYSIACSGSPPPPTCETLFQNNSRCCFCNIWNLLEFGVCIFRLSKKIIFLWFGAGNGILGMLVSVLPLPDPPFAPVMPHSAP